MTLKKQNCTFQATWHCCVSSFNWTCRMAWRAACSLMAAGRKDLLWLSVIHSLVSFCFDVTPVWRAGNERSPKHWVVSSASSSVTPPLKTPVPLSAQNQLRIWSLLALAAFTLTAQRWSWPSLSDITSAAQNPESCCQDLESHSFQMFYILANNQLV